MLQSESMASRLPIGTVLGVSLLPSESKRDASSEALAFRSGACSAMAMQGVHALWSSFPPLELESCTMFGAQEEQTHRPQMRQWCRSLILLLPRAAEQMAQLVPSSSQRWLLATEPRCEEVSSSWLEKALPLVIDSGMKLPLIDSQAEAASGVLALEKCESSLCGADVEHSSCLCEGVKHDGDDVPGCLLSGTNHLPFDGDTEPGDAESGWLFSAGTSHTSVPDILHGLRLARHRLF